MNKVELILDETLADFEIQDWIDTDFSIHYPDIKATIKKGFKKIVEINTEKKMNS